MNPKIKKAWVAALLSGNYLQGRNKLRSPIDSFCCLGVLCNLHAQAHPEIAAKQTKPTTYMSKDLMPHTAVYRWSGLSRQAATNLAEMNDSGSTFSEIATYIQKRL